MLAGIIGGIIGIAIGSSLETIVRRMPIRESLATPPHCMNCGTRIEGIRRFGLICRLKRLNYCVTCNQKLWSQIPWLALSSTATLALSAAVLGLAWALPAYLVFFASLLAITVIDLQHFIIPNRIIYPTLFFCLINLTAAGFIGHNSDALITALIGMAGAWTFFFIVHLINPRGMGFGDVRLAAVIGLLAGWLGLGNVVLSIFLGLISASLIGLVLIAARIKSRKDPIPFGPFLALGATVAILWGKPIADWWL